MNFLHIWAIILRQFYLLRSNFVRIVSLFLWITVDILLWGFLTRYLSYIDKGGFDFVKLLLGAVLFWDFFNRIMYGVTMGFLEDVWARNFLNLFCSPITIKEYLLGLVSSSLIIGSFAFLIMVFIACLVFKLSFFSYGMIIFPFLVVLLIFGTSLGILSMAIMLRFGPSAEWLIWPIPAILSPFVGIFYPVSILPNWMQFISKILPASYIFESLRKVVLLDSVSYLDLFFGFSLALFYLIFFCIVLYLTYNHCLRTGSLTRYSAENIV